LHAARLAAEPGETALAGTILLAAPARQPVSPTMLSIITAWVTGRWGVGGPNSDRVSEEGVPQ